MNKTLPYEKGVIMTPHHPRWKEFREALANKLDSVGGCDGTLDGSMIILSSMNIWQQGSAKYFMELGGYCDCEVLMNVHA